MTFGGIRINVTAVMRRILGTNRILSIFVLAVCLHAVWPATNYNSRLELFNPSTDPSETQSKPAARTIQVTRDRFTGSFISFTSARSKFPEPQVVHAAIPIYQKSFPAADDSQIAEDRYASNLYSSRSVPRASGRGPPRLLA